MTAESPDALRVCVAVPYFSNLEYLDTAVRSIVAQTDPEWRAIVVDDASPEPGAAAVVAALDDQRVSYLRNDHNLGISANFNRCLELGSGDAEIAVVFHADDVLEPGYIAAIRHAHRTFPTATCVAPLVVVIDEDGLPTKTLADAVKRLLWPRRLPTTL